MKSFLLKNYFQGLLLLVEANSIEDAWVKAESYNNGLEDVDEYLCKIHRVEPCDITIDRDYIFKYNANNLPYASGDVIWVAPMYESNYGFFGKGLAGGVFNINEYCNQNKRPIRGNALQGDNLSFAFLDNDNNLCYSDSDRYVGIATPITL